MRVAPVNMTYGGNNAHVWGYEVTGNYFDVLGGPGCLGRTITPADDQKIGAHPSSSSATTVGNAASPATPAS